MEEHANGGNFAEQETLHGQNWPCLRQFCVFLENRVGRLNQLMRHLETMDVRVISLSMVDSVDFANVRLIFNNTDRAREKLELSNFLFSESDVVGVELPEEDMPYTTVCTALMKAEINIHHVSMLRYHRRGRSAVAIYVDDVDRAVKTMEDAGLKVLTEGDLLVDDEFF
ncbi:MAG: acetolactate synthase [Planctomycetaceae bacterium]|nr:acetolactate synthase [Planctomycetaceae bacterium]